MLNAQSLGNEIHHARQQLQVLQNTPLLNNTQDILKGIDELFNTCNRFADQFEQLEKQNTDISQLENQYITLLMDLTEYDAQMQQGHTKQIFPDCALKITV